MALSLSSVKQVAKDFFGSLDWPRRPESVNFEITAACDARCIHCPRLDMDRPMMPMPRALFRRLVDQCVELGVPYLCPNGYGEICTIPIPSLTESLRYISERSRRPRVVINTNGHRMNAERSALFIEHEVHLINVTIDGATKETAESIRVRLNFDQIEANIKRLLSMRDAAGKKHPKVRVGMVAMPQTMGEIDAFLARWKGVSDFVGIGGYSSRLASVPGQAAPAEVVQLGGIGAKPGVAPARAAEPPPAKACVLPFRDLNIWADGRAVLCCEDWNEEFVVGDLNTQTISEIWGGPRLAEVRAKHKAGLGCEISLCAKCNNWQGPSAGARLWS